MASLGSSKPRPALGGVIAVAILYIGASVALLPFIWMLSNSFKTLGETLVRVSPWPFSPEFWPQHLQLRNYTEAWREARFGLYFRNSLTIASMTVAGVLVTSTLAGYAFGRMKFYGRDFLFMVLLATLMVPETVTVIPNFIVVSSLGWVDRLPALTVPFMASAFHIFLLRQFFAQIPGELFDSATIDGAGHIQFLWRIVIPLSKAPIMTLIFLSFIWSWNALQWPLIVTNTPRWRPITVGLTVFMTESGPETNLRMAGAIIAIIPVLVLYFIAQKQFTEGIARTGLKG
jgi:ABC-type glycerol-3-phosphate transport system permease component